MRRRKWIGGWIRGSIYWVDTKVRGRRVRASTGCKTNAGARQYLADLESGVQPLREDALLGEAVRSFIVYQRARKTEKYVKAQARSFDLWRAHLGDCALEAVNADAINSFVEKRRLWGVGVAATNRDLAALSKLYSWGRATDRTKAHPFEKVHQESEKRQIRPHRWVPHEEIVRARAELQEKWADALTVCYGSGLRWSSFARLTVGNVDVARSVLRDPDPKGTTAIEVACTPEVMAAARRCLGRAYPNDEAQQFGRRLRSACARAGVARFTAHDLRVSAASWMYNHGTPLKVIQGILGHASITTTERYVRAGGAVARGPV